MKNLKILLITIITLLVIPFTLKAESKEYVSMNLKETLAAEEIEEAFTNYKETDDQITIYMFRGQGCGVCQSFLNFLNSITEEYGKYFKLKSYEVWYDEDNLNLMDEISNFKGKVATGVPYIIIGDQVFPGYSSKRNDQIKEAIVKLYNTNKKDRYDVFEAYANKDKVKESAGVSSPSVIIWNLIFILVATTIIIVNQNRKYNKIEEEISMIKIKNEKKGTKNEK